MIQLAKALKDLVDSPSKLPDWNKRDDRQVLPFIKKLIKEIQKSESTTTQ